MAGVFPIHLGVMNAQADVDLTCDLITPQPQFCAGFRRLLKDWNDTKCAVVRDTTTGTTSGIGFAGGTEYFDKDAYETFIGANSGAVATLYDQSGGANNMTCDSTSYQPTIESADWDSNEYAMRTNNTNRHLYADLGANNVDLNDSTTFIVFKRYGGGWQLLSFSKLKTNNSPNGVVAGNSYARHRYGSYAVNNWQSGEATDRHVVHQTYDQVNIDGYIDDDQSHTRVNTSNQDNHRYIAISNYRITTPLLGVDSQIYEVIHYNEKLSDADRETIRDDIMNYYGITS